MDGKEDLRMMSHFLTYAPLLMALKFPVGGI